MASAVSPGKVLVTGATGYLGSWCVHTALEAGYTVMGTVRDKGSQKSTFLTDAMEGKPGPFSKAAKERLQLVQVDLLSGEAAWDDVFKGAGFDYVLHTASPFFAKEPDDPNDYIRPAVEGTTSVLKAAINAGVKMTVVTSSIAAIMDPIVHGKQYSGADWSDPDAQGSYSKSKALAEKAAWKLAEGTSMKLCTINPALILGPTLYSDVRMFTAFESGDLMTKVLTNKLPFVPEYYTSLCDVRDVAAAHVKALSVQGAHGMRFPVVSETVLLRDMIERVSQLAPELRIKAHQMPKFVIGLASYFDPVARITYPSIGKQYSFDSSKVTSVLGIQLTPVETFAKDMVENAMTLGAVPRMKAASCFPVC